MNPRRRQLLQAAGAMAAWPLLGTAAPTPARRIPSTGAAVSPIGLGTWLTFSVPPYTEARTQRVAVLRRFFELGGQLVDSSPMYGLSEATLGDALERIGGAPPLFSATKVWIPTRVAGVVQMNASAKLWGLDGFDLMQVHNMLDWEAHLPTLRDWRAEGRIRHIGITTSHGRRHDELLEVIRAQPEFEVLQFSYSIADREAERRLLPAAADAGKAVIINRPFRTGELFARIGRAPLPGWAEEIGCRHWSQALLKFVLSHPAVTVVIPATRRVDHLEQNMAALHGPLPDPALRERMARDFAAL